MIIAGLMVDDQVVGPQITVIQSQLMQLGNRRVAVNHRLYNLGKLLVIVDRMRHFMPAQVFVYRGAVNEVDDPHQIAGGIAHGPAVHKIGVPVHLFKDRRLFLRAALATEHGLTDSAVEGFALSNMANTEILAVAYGLASASFWGTSDFSGGFVTKTSSV